MPQYKIKIGSMYVDKIVIEHNSPEEAIKGARLVANRLHPDAKSQMVLGCKELETK